MKQQTMIGFGLSLLLGLSLASCSSINPFDRAPQWELLQVPEAGTVYDIAGELSENLVVGGLGSIFLTQDQGETWQVVKEDFTIRRFEMRGDSLFAFSIGEGTFYSLDMGLNWVESEEALVDEFVFEVNLSNGQTYRIVPDITFPKQPDTVERSRDGEEWEDVFPFQRYIYSIYADDQDRVYIGTNGWVWDEESNGFSVANGRLDGLVYYVK
ncbi:MAG: hypothetical protein AAFN10_23130 [Bacteroidota bacterium]